MFYQKKFFISFFIITYDLCSGCDRAEYEIKGECCPMCPPGTRVYKHCTRNSSTSCVPCIGPTFTDKPNGLIHCFPCTVCDKGLHLKTVKKCTATSDTVCGALEGNYCIDPYGGGCRAAQKHTTCKPGYFIKHPGTDSTDAVCEKCPENSYSVESSASCTPHTDCESKGLPTVKLGDSVSDSLCGENWIPLLAGIIIVVVIVVVVTVAATYVQNKFNLLKMKVDPKHLERTIASGKTTDAVLSAFSATEELDKRLAEVQRQA
ncbi:tumor necrosis factor receptor superfamily member 14-like [Scleropages formosus]|uniref:tumor necrosis factor receptor superfamily member 14-like n=1 Tax=Scleropages formosus TaxID=113540 RepID=UPI0010FA68F2|nr:tumor necrosis factor receptor superfamily member 14-like [Scleropages formosus]